MIKFRGSWLFSFQNAIIGVLLIAAGLVPWALPTIVLGASHSPETPVKKGAKAFQAVIPYKIDIDLRRLPRAPQWQPGDSIKEIPRKFYGLPGPEAVVEPAMDPLLAIQFAAGQRQALRNFNAPRIDQDGQGFSGVTPPDTVGDVGYNYYIQAINDLDGTTYTVYHKADGSVAAGPFTLASLWSAGVGGCGSGLGDPIVLFDRMAQRWLLSEFSSEDNYLCVYISQTADPIAGGWYNYQFQAPEFPDYPKYGVWRDAYYVASNESSGPAIYALAREQMLAGQPATFQRFSVPPIDGFGFQSLTPADHDGPAAPLEGEPGTFIRQVDDEIHDPGNHDPTRDYLELYQFQVDFSDAANSALIGPLTIDVAEFDSTLCGQWSYECFTQPDGGVEPPPRLDPLREVVMWRLQYRNFGEYETLVGSFVTDVDGADHGGIRWFELRKSGALNWRLHQEGTYAPDENNRWMSSIAMDGDGNIALGFNVVGPAVYPGLRYVGRLAGDAPGVMTYGEYELINGTAANASNRYGDYSAMSIDPSNDSEFWFTGEYNRSNLWSTRIGTFSLTPQYYYSDPARSDPARPTDCGGQSPCHASIWDAMNAASQSSRDIIRIMAGGGTYHENVTIRAPMTVVPGWDGSPVKLAGPYK